MNRRQLLTALGLAPASLFLPSTAGWAGQPAPRRLLIYLSAQGCVPSRWVCDPRGRGDVAWQDDWTTWSEKDFSDSLRPLYPWRHQVTAVGGLGVVSAVSEGKDQQHRLSAAHVLTGAKSVWYTGSALGGGPSVDQVIADHVAAPDQLRSLETQIYRGLGLATRRALYQGALHPLGAADTFQAVWDRLYGPRPASGIRRSLELAGGRFDRLAQDLSVADRHTLAQHRQLLAQVLDHAAGFEARACEAPGKVPAQGTGVQVELEALLPLLTTALACDLTRVVTIQAGEPTLAELGRTSAAAIHSAYAHAIYADPDAEEVMTDYFAYHAARFTSILDALDSVQEGSGTLLDNTVVAWMSELGDSAHGYDDYPVVLAGGRNSGLHLGRYVHYPRTSPVDSGRAGDQRVMGMPHNRVLVSLCHAMGVPVDAMGLRSVPAWDGGEVDLTGALPELLA